jgi:hypothetical protein
MFKFILIGLAYIKQYRKISCTISRLALAFHSAIVMEKARQKVVILPKE